MTDFPAFARTFSGDCRDLSGFVGAYEDFPEKFS